MLTMTIEDWTHIRISKEVKGTLRLAKGKKSYDAFVNELIEKGRSGHVESMTETKTQPSKEGDLDD